MCNSTIKTPWTPEMWISHVRLWRKQKLIFLGSLMVNNWKKVCWDIHVEKLRVKTEVGFGYRDTLTTRCPLYIRALFIEEWLDIGCHCKMCMSLRRGRMWVWKKNQLLSSKYITGITPSPESPRMTNPSENMVGLIFDRHNPDPAFYIHALKICVQIFKACNKWRQMTLFLPYCPTLEKRIHW